jgi:hypothetical protein
MANRLAHLHFFTKHGVPTRLVFVCFVGDADMEGPSSADEWGGALRVARRMLGLSKHQKRIIDIFPHVNELDA